MISYSLQFRKSISSKSRGNTAIDVLLALLIIGLGLLNYTLYRRVTDLEINQKLLASAKNLNEIIEKYEISLLYKFDKKQAMSFKREAEYIPGALNEMIKLAKSRYLEVVPPKSYWLVSWFKSLLKSGKKVSQLFQVIEILDPKLFEIKVIEGCNIRAKPYTNSRSIGTVESSNVLKVIDQQDQWFKVNVKQDQWYKEPLDACENEGWIWNELVKIIVSDKFLKKL